MKKFILILITALSALAASAAEGRLAIGPSDALVLSFESEIRYADFGSPEVYGSLLTHSNMLELHCDSSFTGQTTLSVVTANGRYHNFMVEASDRAAFTAWNEKSGFASPDTVRLSTGKTTHFISSEPLTDIISGSDLIAAEHADEISNIVRAKAIEGGFGPSSFTLVSSRGTVYPYVAVSDEDPAELNVYVSGGPGAEALFSDASVNDIKMRSYGEKVAALPPALDNIGTVKQNMEFALAGLYCRDDILMFHLLLTNHNRLDYEIDFIKCYIKDKKRTKTITVQEDEIFPIFAYNPPKGGAELVGGGKTYSTVLFFKRFTIPQKRILYFEVFERNGGRHIAFPVSDSELLKADILKD